MVAGIASWISSDWMTLEEADLRYLTGVSLIAIQRAGGEEVDYPNPQTILLEGIAFSSGRI